MKRSLPFVLSVFLTLLLQAFLGNGAAILSTQIDKMQKKIVFKEDDILYTPEQEAFMRGERQAESSLFFRWSEVDGFPEIPYAFTDDLVDRFQIKKAFEEWEKNTCLKFKEVSHDYVGNHIYFRRHEEQCNSYVGMIGDGQEINVPEWCEKPIIGLLHEIGHAIGLFHEQARSDRDKYVHINTQNVEEEFLNNFYLANDNNYSVPYDYNSMMHYRPQAFSKNRKITIATINPLYQSTIARQYGFSHMDKLVVNRMYSCIEKNLDKCFISSDPCQNNGYTGKDCQCVCPYGTSGSNCETWTASHNDERLSPFSEKITSEGEIKSPFYPYPITRGMTYTKWIVAPECKRVKLTFNDFSVNCSELFEIRTKDLFDGNWYCNDSLKAGDTLTSDSNEMIIFNLYNSGHAKWSANVIFEDNADCIKFLSTTPVSRCETTDLGNGEIRYKIPTSAVIINDAICIHDSNLTEPGSAKLHFEDGFPVNPGDYLLFEHPYGPPIKLDRSRLSPFTLELPAFFRATFVSKSSGPKRDFCVKYSKQKRDCYESIHVNSSGTVTPQGYRNPDSVEITCEWHFTTAPGSLIELNIHTSDFGNDGSSSYVSVDLQPFEKPEQRTTTIRHLLHRKKPVRITSLTNKVNVLYQGFKGDCGVELKYRKI